MRPLLLPALRRLWRDIATLQLGVDPGRAVVLCDLPPGAADLLDRLDGTKDLDDILHASAADGIDREVAEHLIRVLVGARAVVDAASLAPLPPALDARSRHRLAAEISSLSLLGNDPGEVLARRHRCMVAVHGPARLAMPVATTLASAGVGRVHVPGRGVVTDCDVAPGGFIPADVGRTRPEAATAALRRVAPQVDSRPLPPRVPADLVILAGDSAADSELVGRLVAAKAPHLVAAVRETTGIVGPLVVPGQSSCLACAYLHRCDRDPTWPALAAQLSTPGRRGADALDAGLSAALVGLTALQALAHLDGAGSQAVDGTLELALPDCRVRRRSWPAHPRCGCRSVLWERTG